MRGWLGAVLVLSCGWAEAAVQWTVGDAVVRPGEIAHVEVRVRHEGDLLPGTSFRLFVQGRGAFFTNAVPIESAAGASCTHGFELRTDGHVIQPPAPGVEHAVCRIPVRAYAHAVRERARLRLHAPCGQPGEACLEVASADLRIDGPPHWRDRALIVVPRATAPSPETIVAFDYADLASSAPLRMLEAPRPANVARAVAAFPQDNAYAKTGATANAAVAAVRRSVRAIYRDEASRAAAHANAARDPAVEGVSTDAWFGTRTWPARPRAGEPFALWHTTYVCSPVVPRHFDERTVTVVSDQVLVTVPDHQFVDFAVCPDGEIHALFNMPGLPAGTYRLRLRVETAAPEDPDQASILLTVLPGGNAGSSSAHPVPAGSPVAFVLLVVALSAGAAVAIGYRSSRS